jgi:16S rRNA (cytosine1402-N4)-methyltransferase
VPVRQLHPAKTRSTDYRRDEPGGSRTSERRFFRHSESAKICALFRIPFLQPAVPMMSPDAENRATPLRRLHIPVMLREVLQYLHLEPGLTVVDGTVGAGGHSHEILRRIGPSGMLIGLDRDARMLEIAALHLSGLPCHLHQASYAELRQILASHSLPAVDRILLDLGLSSDQLADQRRGFSFSSDGPLDLRFDASQGESAADLVARLDETELAALFEQFGEEPHSRRIARNIVARRSERPIRTARELADAVAAHQRPAKSAHGRAAGRHPATRVFQALRIAVNHELEQLEAAVKGVLYDCLRPGGVVIIISFHSLEDRLIKQAFRDPNLWQLLTPRAITPSPAEQRQNPRSRSAKLRGARKLPLAITS